MNLVQHSPPRKDEFDLMPAPRILFMLGEINLDQWKCVAELVDNSVDSFLRGQRAGVTIKEPRVTVYLPASSDEAATVRVLDNGPGMSAEVLEKAVRAGWTNNDPIGFLGMFGMGFNIATARLGNRTTVWTARPEDAEWAGVQIDFELLVKQGHYKTPRLSRPKVTPGEHGTEIIIERLKENQRAWLAKAVNQGRIGRELRRTYAAMLRPGGRPIYFQLRIGAKVLEPWFHCVWGDQNSPKREFITTSGAINAFQQIDTRMDPRPFCNQCWQWLPAGENKCGTCGSGEFVKPRERRVYGWVGIQRYLSVTDFGIDVLRNGRKIELANRDLFSWSDGRTKEPEYPTDDPRGKGRIVGEIHLDHCRVTYMKDGFDRTDPAWEEMVRIVRGDGPLRPLIARNLGFGENTSPLYRMYGAFRRNSPKPKNAEGYAKIFVVPSNEAAEQYADKFHEGNPDYLSDEKWWALIEETRREELLETHSEPASGEGGFSDLLEPDAAAATAEVAAGKPGSPTVAPAPPRYPMPSLSIEYTEDVTGQKWRVEAHRVAGDDPILVGGLPWLLRPQQPTGIFDFFVNPNHEAFRSVTLEPRDALMAELAWQAMDYQKASRGSAPFSAILSGLRMKYLSGTLDPADLLLESSRTLDHISQSVRKIVQPGDGRALFGELSNSDQQAIRHRMAIRQIADPDGVIEAGGFLEFAPRPVLLDFFRSHPEMFFDGFYWEASYSSIDQVLPTATQVARDRRMMEYEVLLADAIWLEEQGEGGIHDASRPRLLRAAAALALLEPAPSNAGDI